MTPFMVLLLHCMEQFPPLMILWEVFVSCSLLGFGFILLRLVKQIHAPVALAGCLGISVWLFLGGFLNYLKIASAHVLVGLLTASFFAGLTVLPEVRLRDRCQLMIGSLPRTTLFKVVGFLLCSYILLLFLSQVSGRVWNKWDDLPAYLPLAEKAAALNSLQSDPFSDRMVDIGLGGGLFLNATMLAGSKISAAGYLDGGFGLLLFIGTTATFLRRMGLSVGKIFAVLCFLPVFILCKVNLTAAYLPAALLFGVMLVLVEFEEISVLRKNLVPGLLVGLLLGAEIALKSTDIVFSCTLILCFTLSSVAATRNVRYLLNLVWLLPILMLFVLPWMLHSKQIDGTLLFPVLGQGYSESAYGFIPLPGKTSSVGNALFLALPDETLVLMAFLLMYFLKPVQNSRLYFYGLAFLFASIVTIPVNALASGGDTLDRYALFFLTPAALIILAAIFQSWSQIGSARRGAGVLVATCWISFYVFIVNTRLALYDQRVQIASLIGRIGGLHEYDTLVSAEDFVTISRQLRKAQDVIPPRAVIMDETLDAFGYDWRRNKVYIADHPGMAGLPPGVPLGSDPEAMRRYLVSCGIRYLIMDRRIVNPVNIREFLQHPIVDTPMPAMLRHPLWRRSEAGGSWARMQSTVSQSTRYIMWRIAEDHQPIYDDGQLVVIPLI